jgi:hypothetical protein
MDNQSDHAKSDQLTLIMHWSIANGTCKPKHRVLQVGPTSQIYECKAQRPSLHNNSSWDLKKEENMSMHLALAIFASAPFFSYALVHIR